MMPGCRTLAGGCSAVRLPPPGGECNGSQDTQYLSYIPTYLYAYVGMHA